MKKMINGELVDMTPVEIADRQAEESSWASRHIPTDDEIDQDQLNRALIADGSVTRAFGELLFGVMSGKIPINPTLTQAGFKSLLLARMRTKP